MDFDFQISPHEEAAAVIREKPVLAGPLARRVFEQLLPEIKNRVFLISGIESANVLQAIQDEITALPRGQTWTESKSNIIDALSPYLGEEGADQRATLLLRTHGFQAFQASTWRLAHEDRDTTHLQYLATEDDRVRDTHLALNGIVLPKDDPFWSEHYPPWEWNCRCRVRTMNVDQVDAEKKLDEDREPEEKLVLEGASLRKLNEGTIIRGTRSYDVLPPTGENAFRFHPNNLRIDLSELRDRYDPEVFAQFEAACKATDLPWMAHTGKPWTLWDWLRGEAPSGKPGVTSGLGLG